MNADHLNLQKRTSCGDLPVIRSLILLKQGVEPTDIMSAIHSFE